MNNNNTNVLKKIKYISQDAVFELIDNAPIIAGNENESLISAPKLSDKIYCLPAADVKPVAKGRWGIDPQCPICGEDRYKDLDADIWAAWEPPFCPNCGAKMTKYNGDCEND